MATAQSAKQIQLKKLAQIRDILANLKDELIRIQEDEPYIWALDSETEIFKLFDQQELILSQWSTQIQTRNERNEERNPK